jgi:hypothetical protein
MNFLAERATIKAQFSMNILQSQETTMFIFGILNKRVVTMWQYWVKKRSGDSGTLSRLSVILL